jgi:prepilin-type N-terminal cleavage/methylation domain-containing protein/prepilin-type processing-associated H-X9-DG protein
VHRKILFLEKEFGTMHRRSQLRGFTLIELLVVIAIIAILAAILFPVFAQARAKARQTSSLSNLKNINLAFQMYAQDYDERFPYWNWWESSENGGCGGRFPATPAGPCGWYGSLWINSLQPYIKNTQIYADPSDRGNLSVRSSDLYWWTPGGQTDVQLIAKGFNPQVINQKLSYGMNEYVSNDTDGFNGMAAQDRPAQTLLVAESITSFACCGSRPDRNNPADPRHRFILRRVSYANQCDGTWAGDSAVHNAAWESNQCTRHAGGENVGYADGHVKWSKAPQITWDLFHGDQAQ